MLDDSLRTRMWENGLAVNMEWSAPGPKGQTYSVHYKGDKSDYRIGEQELSAFLWGFSYGRYIEKQFSKTNN